METQLQPQMQLPLEHTVEFRQLFGSDARLLVGQFMSHNVEFLVVSRGVGFQPAWIVFSNSTMMTGPVVQPLREPDKGLAKLDLPQVALRHFTRTNLNRSGLNSTS